MIVANEDLNQLWKGLRIAGWAAVAVVMLAPLAAK